MLRLTMAMLLTVRHGSALLAHHHSSAGWRWGWRHSHRSSLSRGAATTGVDEAALLLAAELGFVRDGESDAIVHQEGYVAPAMAIEKV